MLAVQSEVTLVILEPETPGGLRLSMDCKMLSSSATAEVMATLVTISSTQLKRPPKLLVGPSAQYCEELQMRSVLLRQ